ncbi:hypothetical protein LX32DRAFT_162556 [Colletotrichum zoysiae]|uniref:Uncharacterized protein n=1 Tax=Colletotrichum zoysiae TaxID=1216348 RepID=A0AAD9H7H5_9PEZI|nr:hypothetical protein LX32DRAFT_162556 [Colletotrichum zoysiae]
MTRALPDLYLSMLPRLAAPISAPQLYTCLSCTRPPGVCLPPHDIRPRPTPTGRWEIRKTHATQCLSPPSPLPPSHRANPVWSRSHPPSSPPSAALHPKHLLMRKKERKKEVRKKTGCAIVHQPRLPGQRWLRPFSWRVVTS